MEGWGVHRDPGGSCYGGHTTASHLHMCQPEVMKFIAVKLVATQLGTSQFDTIQVVATQITAIELASTQLVVTNRNR